MYGKEITGFTRHTILVKKLIIPKIFFDEKMNNAKLRKIQDAMNERDFCVRKKQLIIFLKLVI